MRPAPPRNPLATPVVTSLLLDHSVFPRLPFPDLRDLCEIQLWSLRRDVARARFTKYLMIYRNRNRLFGMTAMHAGFTQLQ